MSIKTINNLDAVNEFGADKNSVEKYKEIITRFKDLGIFIVFAPIPNAPISYSSSEIMRSIKENKNYMVFEDLSLMKVTEISPSLVNGFKKPIELGDAYYIKNGVVKKVKTPKGYMA